jgi:hypothetical protein
LPVSNLDKQEGVGMGARDAVRCVVLSLVVLLIVSSDALAQGVGAIAGTVADSSGAVLPGVTVTLTSAQGTVGGNREVLTDERGAYQFLRLVPGTYSIRAVLQDSALHTGRHHVNSDQTSCRRSARDWQHGEDRGHGRGPAARRSRR